MMKAIEESHEPLILWEPVLYDYHDEHEVSCL
jgi:hypothetical protein